MLGEFAPEVEFVWPRQLAGYTMPNTRYLSGWPSTTSLGGAVRFNFSKDPLLADSSTHVASV